MLTRVRADLAMKQWAERLIRKGGAQKAKVALARKLAVILHRIWSDGSVFDPHAATA